MHNRCHNISPIRGGLSDYIVVRSAVPRLQSLSWYRIRSYDCHREFRLTGSGFSISFSLSIGIIIYNAATCS